MHRKINCDRISIIFDFIPLTGDVKDKDGKIHFTLEGAWDENLIAKPIEGALSFYVMHLYRYSIR